MIHCWVLPASGGRDSRLDFFRSPCARLVLVDGRAGLQDWIDDSPGLFDVVLPGEQGGIAVHGVAQHALVRVHLIGAREPCPQHLRGLADRFLPRRDDVRADGDRDVGADPKAAIVRLEIEAVIHRGRLAESDDDFGARHGQALSGADVEGHTLPAPGIDLQSQGSERLHRGIRRHAFLRSVAAKLSAYEAVRGEGGDRLEDLHLLVADGFAVWPGRRLHGQVAQDLTQMILDDVAHGARLVVERAPALDSELFGHRDLHALDVIAVPERLQESVGEAEEEHVVYRPLAEVVVDPEDRCLIEGAEQDPVELLRGGDVVAERFLDDDAGAVRAARLAELLHDQLEQHGRDGQVVRRPSGGAQLFADGLERRRVLVVAVDVAQQAAQLAERRGIEAPVLFEAVLGTGLELLELPAGLRHADDRHVEVAALHHRLQRRKDLLVGEIAGRAEEHEGVGVEFAHRGLRLLRRLFEVTAELIAHGREQLVGEVRFAARGEALVQRGGEDGGRHRLVDGRPDRPPPLAGIGHAPLETLERRILDERGSREVEQPGGDDAPASPHLGDVGQVEVVLIVLGIAQRRRLGVDLVAPLADVRGAQDAEPLGVRGHDAVLDAVVDHLDEVAAAARSAVEIPPLGGAADGFPPGRARDVADAGSQGREDRIEVLDRRRLAADHQAVPALPSPDAAAGSDVYIADALLAELLPAADIVDVVGIAAVDEDVPRRQMRQKVIDGRVHDRRWNHQPDGPRRLQLLHEIRDRRGPDGLRPSQLLDRFRRPVEDHALVVAREKPLDHVGAHAAESDHSELHHRLLCRSVCASSSVSSFIWSRATWSRAIGSRAVRRRLIAAATPPRSPKIAEPATSTVAPARTTSGAVVASMPPSTSTSHPGLCRSVSSRTRSIFGEVVRMNCWWPKPGSTVMTSTWSRSWTISSSTADGVAGLMATAARLPSVLIFCTVRCRLLLPSQWTRNESEPAAANSSRKKSGSEIIRWISRGRAVTRRRDWTITAPIERFGTKCPSITSTWIRSAPLCSASATCWPKRAKSAARIDGASLTVRLSMSPAHVLDATKMLSMDASSRALYSASDCWADSPSTSAREKLATTP